MSRRYKYATTLGAEDEIEVTASFTVDWGSPESGRFGRPEDYDPGAGDGVEDVRVESTFGPHPCPMSVAEILKALEETKHVDAMLTGAREEAAAEHEAALEHQYEARREDALIDQGGYET